MLARTGGTHLFARRTKIELVPPTSLPTGRCCESPRYDVLGTQIAGLRISLCMEVCVLETE